MDGQFLERIENPRSGTLQRLLESAVAHVEDQLGSFGATDLDEWTLKKEAFVYYYDWTEDNPDYVFLLDTPETLRSHHTREIELIQRLKDEYVPLALVKINRGFAVNWLVSTRNFDFIRRFLSTCSKNDLIELDGDGKDYLHSQQFFEDFYLTTIVKYRAPRSAVGSEEVRSSFSEQLRFELETLDPDLIFTFGKRTWNLLKEELAPEPVKDVGLDESKITELHGHVYQTNRTLDTYVLPLAHLSPQVYGAHISEQEYMRRMEEGLQRWGLATSDWMFGQHQ